MAPTSTTWATRLIHEGNGRLFVDERTLWPNGQFVIGLLVVNTKFLKTHPDLVKKWIRANIELTDSHADLSYAESIATKLGWSPYLERKD